MGPASAINNVPLRQRRHQHPPNPPESRAKGLKELRLQAEHGEHGRDLAKLRARRECGKFAGERILESFASVRKAPADMALGQFGTLLTVPPLGGGPFM